MFLQRIGNDYKITELGNSWLEFNRSISQNRTVLGPVTLDAAAMAILHRLRFEADTGMHRMSIAECPVELQRFALIQLDDDGKPVITVKGRQALKHFACVRALNSIQCGQDALMMSEEIRIWLESNMFLQRIGNDYKVTELGSRWLEFNRSISHDRLPRQAGGQPCVQRAGHSA
jgi:hypothetical protein